MYWVLLLYICSFKINITRHSALVILQTQCLGLLRIWTLKKSYTMCYLFYCVGLWYIQSFKINLRRHTVFDISPGNICFVSWFDLWKSRHYVLASLMCWFGVYFFIKWLINQTHRVSNLTNMHLGFSRFDQWMQHTLCDS